MNPTTLGPSRLSGRTEEAPKKKANGSSENPQSLKEQVRHFEESNKRFSETNHHLLTQLKNQRAENATLIEDHEILEDENETLQARIALLEQRLLEAKSSGWSPAHQVKLHKLSHLVTRITNIQTCSSCKERFDALLKDVHESYSG